MKIFSKSGDKAINFRSKPAKKSKTPDFLKNCDFHTCKESQAKSFPAIFRDILKD